MAQQGIQGSGVRSEETSASARDGEVDISGLDKAALLAALYNHSQPAGMGWLQALPGDMTVEHARELIDSGANPDYIRARDGIYFDYLYGRPLKIDLGGEVLRTYGYNRDNGDEAAERIVADLRAKAAA
jgi:hypothetical protein